MRTLVVLPTYNEIFNVELMLRTLNEIVPECHVLVVDDASPDGTAKRAHAVGAELAALTSSNAPPKTDSATPIAPALPGDSNATTTILSRSTATFLMTRDSYPSFSSRQRVRGGDRIALHQGRPDSQLERSRRLLSRGGNEYAS